MFVVMRSGFLTGLLLQIAIGPVFFFILNVSLQKTVRHGLSAVVAVTLVDYIFITLAVLGVGKLLEKPGLKRTLGIMSAIVLVLFGTAMIVSMKTDGHIRLPDHMIESGYISSFISAFILTSSSPLTIVFWTSLFAARAMEKGYTKNQLMWFGIAAGSATFVFLGCSVLLLSTIGASMPPMLLRILNTAVGSLLVVYGMIRLFKIVMHPKSDTK